MDFISFGTKPNPIAGGNLWLSTDGQLYLEDEPVTICFVTKKPDSIRTESDVRTEVLGSEQFSAVYSADSLPDTLTGNLFSTVLVGSNIAKNVTTLFRCILIGTQIFAAGTAVSVNRQIIFGDIFGNAGNFNGGGIAGNVVIGLGIGSPVTTADGNTLIGNFCCPNITGATANTIMGHNACTSLTSGGNNCAMGSFALAGITTGINNIAMGVSAGSAVTGAGSNNIMLSNIGQVGDSGRIRIGTAGTHTTCFVAGISGVNVGPSPQARISASGQLGVQVSSLKYKQNVTDLTDTEKIYSLRPVEFEYIDFPGIPCYGLIAEETFDVYPELACCGTKAKTRENVETVDYEKMYIAMLKELQKLKAEVDLIKQHLNL